MKVRNKPIRAGRGEQWAVKILTTVVAMMLVGMGYRWLNHPTSHEGKDAPAVRAQVVGIADRSLSRHDMMDGHSVEQVTISFFARILSGEHRGELVSGMQQSDPFYPIPQKEVAQGDKILLHGVGESSGAIDWQLGEYLRTDSILLLFGGYVLLLLLLGGLKGMWSLVALGLTCAAVFLVFIPAVLAGKNIYFWACAVCLYSIMGTLLLVSGASKKSFAAGVGCAAGVGVAGILTLLMTRVLLLTGFVDEQSVYLLSMGNGVEIDLKGVIFAGILIGALGAVMDVAMSIASALEELAVRTEHPTFSSLLRSGLTIGRDIMGTMANTLVLAYIGSSLSVVLLLIAYASSALGMLNREMMVVEMLQALVGSIGILCAIPLTSLICAAIYPAAAERPIAEGIQPPMAVSEETAGGSR